MNLILGCQDVAMRNPSVVDTWPVSLIKYFEEKKKGRKEGRKGEAKEGRKEGQTGRFISAHNSMTWSIRVGTSCGHIASTVRKQHCECCAQLPFSILFSLDTSRGIALLTLLTVGRTS